MNYLNNLRSNLFFYFKGIIEQKRKNFLVEFFLFFLSLFYRSIVFFKNFFYDYKILQSKKVKSKVISIGNIDSGGTGKTPFTIFLAKMLLDKKVAIVTRGYKSKYENKSLIVNGESNFNAFEMGDEAFLLKNHLKDASIFIGKNKLNSALFASEMNFDIILIDDGFQYRKIKKDLEIVILNANKPFFKNSCLPKGLLRESPKSLKRADFIIINNAKKEDKELEEKIKEFTSCPIIYSKPFSNRLLDSTKTVRNLKNKTKVALFCGIANPCNFFKTIEDMGLQIVNKLELFDHQTISSKKLEDFICKSAEKKAEFIITTEKDFVKLNIDNKTILPILYLEIILNIVANKHNLQTLVEKINKLFNN